MTNGKAGGIDLIFSEDGVFDVGISGLQDDFAKAAALVCVREGMDPQAFEISITFETEEGIRALNARYREKDAVTDVLSFPMYESAAEIRKVRSATEPGENRQVLSLGDVVICPAAARRQAAEYGHSERREFVYLFVHSMLHLFGYDHVDSPIQSANDNGMKGRAEMRAAEEDVMQKIGIDRNGKKG
ncbi:endoribonuclease YbeY [Clostridia bacterium]|nr:endoribonuclease YbeY [Clostridia bacterium]